MCYCFDLLHAAKAKDLLLPDIQDARKERTMQVDLLRNSVDC
jgi:hypothetical protein